MTTPLHNLHLLLQEGSIARVDEMAYVQFALGSEAKETCQALMAIRDDNSLDNPLTRNVAKFRETVLDSVLARVGDQVIITGDHAPELFETIMAIVNGDGAQMKGLPYE